MTTYEEAIAQLQAAIAAKGKFSISNLPDYALGVATANKQQLQSMLDSLLQKKGVITPEDQTAINDLLAKQKQATSEKLRIVAKNVGIAVGTVLLGTAFWFTFKQKKK